MALLKCVCCKERFPSESMIKLPIGNAHSFECATRYAQKTRQKQARKQTEREAKARTQQNAKRKREFLASDTRHQHKLTQQSFNKMRVLEEMLWFHKRSIEPYCISCGKTKMDWCCGHFKTVGSSGALRYERKNTFLQCNFYCNMNKSGNISGCKNTHGFKEGLALRFREEGGAIIAFCEMHQADIRKWTGEELIVLRKEFNKTIIQLRG